MDNISPAKQLDNIIRKHDDWRGQKLTQIKVLINQSDPDIEQDVKWKTPSNPDGVPVWYHHGMICTVETYKKHIRIAFAKGPELQDPHGLINSYRAIIIHENEEIDADAFTQLIRQAIQLNLQAKTKTKSK